MIRFSDFGEQVRPLPRTGLHLNEGGIQILVSVIMKSVEQKERI
ncbi:MAG: hypothetical protein WDA22_07190 [Bacteroidota bacterium]